MQLIKMNEDNATLKVLFEYAKLIDGAAGQRVTAAVRDNNTCIGFGHNSYKTSPFQVRYARNEHSIYMHAEIEAIARATRRTGNSLEGCDLYVVRAGRNGKPALAKPCEGCMRAIFEFGIERVYYS